MVTRIDQIVGRTFAIILLLCGASLTYISYSSSEALGNFYILFLILGLIMTLFGAIGLIVKFK